MGDEMPNVFISWSGAKSHQVAQTLHRWLPVVLQSVKPFISSEDLRKGGRWVSELSKELEKDNFGIVCLTPSNLTAPWILFEAGALSKSVGDSQVVPFLVGVKPSELPPPLTQFNAAVAEKSEFLKMAKAINDRAGEDAVGSELIDRSVEACWPGIEKELKEAIEVVSQPPAANRSDEPGIADRFDAILQELLVLNRAQSKILSSPDQLIPMGYWEHLQRNSENGMPSRSHGVWPDLIDAIAELDLAAQREGSDFILSRVRRLVTIGDYLSSRIEPLSSRHTATLRRSRRQAIPVDDDHVSSTPGTLEAPTGTDESEGS